MAEQAGRGHVSGARQRPDREHQGAEQTEQCRKQNRFGIKRQLRRDRQAVRNQRCDEPGQPGAEDDADDDSKGTASNKV